VIQTYLGGGTSKSCLVAIEPTTATRWTFALAPSEVANRDLIIGRPIDPDSRRTVAPTVIGHINWTTESAKGAMN
jgi:hypothetical protein